jgi:hypothetical protein
MQLRTQSRIPFFLIFGLFFIFCAAFALAGVQERAWKGKVEVENGVKIFRNPAEPLFGEFVFDLREDLNIGGDPTKETYYFPKGAVLSVDREGNLYVADMGNRLVEMFDRTGAFVRQIGRQGQGPGEYLFPSRVLFDGEGNPVVWGGRDLNCYDKDGVFKKKVMFKTFLSTFMMGPKDTIIGTTQPGLGPGGPKYTLVQLNADGSLVRTIAEFRGEFSESQKAITLHWYSNSILLSPLAADLFCYGFSENYRIYVADAEGRTAYIIAKDEKPQSISGKEKDETKKSGVFLWMGEGAKENAVFFPEHRPFFSRISSDDAGRLYVVKSGSILEKDAPRQVDVFSKDGIFLYRMTWSFLPAEIKAGFFYEVHTDKETGEITIVRHKIVNWTAMKAGL